VAKMEENGGFMTEFWVPPILTRRTLYAEIELQVWQKQPS
jgi:hypothetical protein